MSRLDTMISMTSIQIMERKKIFKVGDSAAVTKGKFPITAEFAAWVEEFVDEHEALLRDLAKK